MTKWTLKKDPFAKREKAKYSRPIPSREYIMEYIEKKNQSMTYAQLQREFGLRTKVDQEALRRRLCAMVRDGQLLKTRRGKFDVMKYGDVIRAHIIGHQEGFGFAAPEDGTARIFLSVREMRGVLDGDEVLVRITNVDRQNRREGMITEVLGRKVTEVVGRFFIEGGVGFVEADNPRINQDIIVPLEFRSNAKAGQIVNVELVSYPTKHSQPVGRVVEVLGEYMAAGLEVEIAIRAYDLPHIWLEDVKQQLESIDRTIPEGEIKRRKDLRSLSFVTIDGEDAKDFDDAVYCESRKLGGWRLYVAIADVGHYVPLDTALDQAAKERGTSVYFPGKVLPMLPAVLSNNLCSLKPREDRLSIVCEMTISKQGRITRSRFYEAIIRSHERLTYNKVAKLIEGSDALLMEKYAESLPLIYSLYALYKILSSQRVKRGALDFDTPDVRVEFGSKRKIKRLYPLVRNEAHRIIEECMLCANISAAKFLIEEDVDGLFRVHDGPKAEKIQNLKQYLGELGLNLGGGDLPLPTDYSALLSKIEGRPDAHIIQTILLRSLSRAFYSPDNDGHFGLAFDEYTHFTSPIRRYPDLVVHRAIKAILRRRDKKDLPSYDTLKVLGEHCSMTERRADEATRDALDWLKCEYMQNKLGETFEAIISSVAGHGFYCEIKDLYIEGLVHIASLSNDYYRFDPVHHRLIGERTHKTFKLGDVVQVRVDRVDLESKNIDFSLISCVP